MAKSKDKKSKRSGKSGSDELKAANATIKKLAAKIAKLEKSAAKKTKSAKVKGVAGCSSMRKDQLVAALTNQSQIVGIVISVGGMTFANVGTLGTMPGKRDEVVALLTGRSSELADAGCLLYEVGVNDDEPDSVFVSELWESAEAHQASLQLDSVRAAIAEARPLLSGQFGGSRFTVVGSPLRT